ncbi:MAG TPA: hypothetical protein VKH36_03965 [Acidimicrobiia bacterium]|nr:hypothetical protein [Acidimicrobiia bacterium]
MSADGNGRFESTAAEGIEITVAAVSAMERANRRILRLMRVRSARPWTADEFTEYLDLSRRERAAHRRYVIGRDRFDHARRLRSGKDPRGIHPAV